MSTGDLWVVTSYFNPMGYRRRLATYRAFRASLDLPLITVELAYGPDFELTQADATHLVQLRATDILWQKERLLNVALRALPDDCRFVAWLDCDVLFQRRDWAHATVASLADHALVQPFSVVYDLDRSADITTLDASPFTNERVSMAARHVDGGVDFAATSTCTLGQYSPGHAWAARREVLDVGLYDAMILGSGDLAMAMAALGRWEGVVAAYAMNDRQARHYREWAARWHAVVQGNLGVVEGALYHVWHGSLADRGYARRYALLQGHEFDPHQDLAIAENGSWRWNSAKQELQRDVAAYFASRKEDG
jgi:hypothetical protein